MQKRHSLHWEEKEGRKKGRGGEEEGGRHLFSPLFCPLPPRAFLAPSYHTFPLVYFHTFSLLCTHTHLPRRRLSCCMAPHLFLLLPFACYHLFCLAHASEEEEEGRRKEAGETGRRGGRRKEGRRRRGRKGCPHLSLVALFYLPHCLSLPLLFLPVFRLISSSSHASSPPPPLTSFFLWAGRRLPLAFAILCTPSPRPKRLWEGRKKGHLSFSLLPARALTASFFLKYIFLRKRRKGRRRKEGLGRHVPLPLYLLEKEQGLGWKEEASAHSCLPLSAPPLHPLSASLFLKLTSLASSLLIFFTPHLA